jgi:hypothetical protein
MNKQTWIFTALLTIALGAAFVANVPAGTEKRAQSTPEPSPRAVRSGVLELVSATPFELAVETTHAWRAEQPRYRSGYLLVLAVDPELVRPRQVAEPVLYAGAQTLERVNHGYESGRVVAVLPAVGGMPDLASTEFFFGAAELPEQVGSAWITNELALARARGVTPFDATEIARALAAGGPALTLGERFELDERAALLVLEHAPAEQDLGHGLLVPRVK